MLDLRSTQPARQRIASLGSSPLLLRLCLLVAVLDDGALSYAASDSKSGVKQLGSVAIGPTVSAQSSHFTVTTADKNKMFMVSGTTTVSLPAASSASAGFFIQVKNTGSSYVTVTPAGSDNLDGVNGSFYLYLPTTSLLLVCDGSSWQVANAYGQTGRVKPVLCDDSASNRCYARGSEPNAAQTAGVAYTPSGKMLKIYPLPDGTSAWVQMGGSNILALNFLDRWQMQLPVGGKMNLVGDNGNVGGPTSSTTLFTNVGTLYGYRCPPHVYVNDSDKVHAEASPNGAYCLFYDYGAISGKLDGAGTSQTTLGQIGMGEWRSGYGYGGNVDACAQKGMRLPTLYETTAANPHTRYAPSDATPIYASHLTGVPSAADASWTASAYTLYSAMYWMWSGTSAGYNFYYARSYSIRCVLP